MATRRSKSAEPDPIPPLPPFFPDTGRRWKVQRAESVEELERAVNAAEAMGYAWAETWDEEQDAITNRASWIVVAVREPEEEIEPEESGGTDE